MEIAPTNIRSSGGVITRVAKSGEKIVEITNLFNREVLDTKAQPDTLDEFHQLSTKDVESALEKGLVGVTVNKNKLLGAVFFNPLKENESAMEIAYLAVKEKERRKGYATNLLRIAEQIATAAGGTKVYAMPIGRVDKSITDAEKRASKAAASTRQMRNFYIKHGYGQDVELTDRLSKTMARSIPGCADMNLTIFSKDL
jgi:GNAT superfamily N-acetyltransferase